ncbi:hypothetical protein GF377_07085 [candidate division GN15 bacterium]|nr:hypothetical protein [candidate division GN15 bacterium]
MEVNMDSMGPSAPDVQSAAPATESGLSTKGLWQVFASPAEFFTKLRSDPKILVPYIAIAIIWAVTLYLLKDLIMEAQIEVARNSARGLPPNAEAQMRAFAWTTPVFGTLAMMLVPLMMAGLAQFFGQFIFGGKASFRQALSASLYCEFLFAVGSILLVPLALAKGGMDVSLSLAVLVADQGMQSLTYVALSKVSVFHIWELIVAGIAFGVMYQVPRNKGYLISVLSLGLLIVLHVGLSAIGLAAG